MSLFELTILKIHSFPVLFSFMLWHNELKFCIHLCFTVLQIKFEFCEFVSICLRVMSLLELRILEIQSFRTFLLHALMCWAEILHITLFNCTTHQVWESSICVNFCGSYAPFGTYNTENTQFSAYFFSYILWHIELKVCIWLCFIVLQIKFKCHQFLSIFCRSYAPIGT